MAPIIFAQFSSAAFLLLLIISPNIATVDGRPSCTIHNNRTIDSSSFSVQLLEEGRPDLEPIRKYYTTLKLMVLEGIWARHYTENYDSTGFVYGTGEHLMSESYWADSVRFVGEEGSRRLNLYYGIEFKFNTTAITTNSPIVTEVFSSVVLVGGEHVELFSENDYLGRSLCIAPEVSIDGAFSSMHSIIPYGFQPGDVRSIRFGLSCSASMKADMTNVGTTTELDDPAAL